MTKEELKQIIREEILSVLKEEFGEGYGVSTSAEEMDERTVARREPPRKMTKPQVKGRDGIGKKLLNSKRAVSYFKKKFGADWKSYLYASATNKAIDKKDD
jgi:hypothetical protein